MSTTAVSTRLASVDNLEVGLGAAILKLPGVSRVL